MKYYRTISLAAIGAIIAVLASTVFSQKPSTLVSAFHESLKSEEAKDFTKSIQSLEAVYSDHKEDYLLNLRLGWLHYLAKNYEQSRKYYSQAFSRSGDKSVEALLGMTLPFSARNEWDNVSATYQSVLKLDPMNYTANLRLGQIMLNRGIYGEAKNYLEKVHAIYPGSYEPNLSLGWTYVYLGNKKKAELLLNAAMMLSPGDTLASKGLQLLKK